jgi:hypothetical protein
LYYNNTYDGQGEIEVKDLPELEQVAIDDDDCESCKI